MKIILDYLRITIVKIHQEQRNCPYYAGVVNICVAQVGSKDHKAINGLLHWLLVQPS